MRPTNHTWTYEIIFVDTSRAITDPMLLGFSRNLAEFWFYRFKDSANITDVRVVGDHNVAVCLAAYSKADFLIVASLGNTFHNVNPLGFLDALSEELTEDTFIMGHILDRKPRYFEVHGQCFVINTRLYKGLQDRPVHTSKPGRKVVIERSPENFHDGYTPTWIRAMEPEVWHIANPAPGSDLIATGLPVKPFPQSVRDAKLFLYPHKPTHRGQLTNLLRRSGPNRHRHYAFSYEPIPAKMDFLAPLDYIACPANGLNLFKYLHSTGFNDGLTIQLYDINPTSLEIYRRIMTNWNGLDYDGLFDNMRTVVRSLRIDDYWQEFMGMFGGPGEWLRFLARVRAQDIRIDTVDLLDVTGNFDWDVSGNALFVASNIFDFSETGLYYNTEHRVLAYQKLLDSLPDRTWMHAIFPLRENQDLCSVGEERLEPIHPFPWRK